MNDMTQLARAIVGGGRKAASSEHLATVLKKSEDGTYWVRILGGAEETPITTPMVEAADGDTVHVSISGGRSIMTGNATSPTAAGRTVRSVSLSAQTARQTANDAMDVAGLASRAALDAVDSAEVAAESAAYAQTAANKASYALAEVENVVGTVNWIAEHGEYVLTSDTAIVDGKAYYTRNGTAPDYVYTFVTEPTSSGLSAYYELSIDSAVSQYIASHLFLTDAGLYVIKDDSGYKALLSNTGMVIYDPSGRAVATYGEGITFDSNRPLSIGNQNAYIQYYDSNNDGVADSIRIKADSISIGSSNVGSTIEQISGDLEDYKDSNDAAIAALQSQVDGQIEAYYYSVDPTTSNAPANGWTTEVVRERHRGDLYYNVASGHSWRWMKDGSTWFWQQIPDSDAAAALAEAQAASTLAGSKRRIFTATPVAPYDVGDLWVTGSIVKYATQLRSGDGTDSGSYHSSDWATTATDDTTANAVSSALTAETNQRKAQYATSSTGAGTQAKTASCSNFALYTGVRIAVKFSNANTHTTPTLNVNSTGAKTIKSYTGAALSEAEYKWVAGATLEFVYDGTYWRIQDGGTVKRIASAETSITSNSEAIELKANASDVYTQVQANALLEVKANKATLTSEINASADTVKISADRVNIEGAAIFTGNGRLSSASLNNTYDAKGSASAAQSAAISAAALDATSKANAAQAAAISAAATDATNKVNAANAQEQLIYKQAVSGTSSMSGTTTWVTATGESVTSDTSGLTPTWTTKRPTYRMKYPVLFVATQRKTVGGTITCTTPMIDDTATIIDGGNIITNSITADKLNVNNINASGSLTVGALSSATQADVLNSNIDVGGRNLLKFTASPIYAGENTEANRANGWCRWNNSFTVDRTTDGIKGTWGDGITGFVIPFVYDDVVDTDEVVLSFDYRTNATSFGSIYYLCRTTPNVTKSVSFTPTVNETVWQHAEIKFAMGTHGDRKAYALLYPYVNQNGKWLEIRDGSMKLERGNKATDWTPAPEDMATASTGIYYATCSTAAGTAVKVATTERSGFTLVPGAMVNVKFSNTNSAAVTDLKLDVNGTGEKPIKYIYNASLNNLPGVGYLVANNMYTFRYDGTNWVAQIMYNTNDNTIALYTKYYNSIKAKTALRVSSIIGCGTDGLYSEVQGGSAFDLASPLLWCNKAIAANGTDYANIYTQIYDRTFATCYDWFTGTANSIVYLVGTVSGNTYTVDSSNFLTCTQPSTSDGKCYIPIGRLGNQSNGKNYFNYMVSVPVQLYAYKDGAFGPVSTREAAAVQANLDAEETARKAVYGTCSTAAGTAEKAVTCTGFDLFTGARLTVKFTTASTVNAPTLNVNSSGAKAIWVHNTVTSSNNPLLWAANATLTFVYDGSVWVLEDEPAAYSGTSSTAATTRDKATSIVGAFVVNGTTVSIRFSTASTYAANSMRLNVSSTGAAVVYKNNAATSTTNTLVWSANTVLTFVRNSSGWFLVDGGLNKYITVIDENGIQVHPSGTTTDYAQINASGMDIVRNDVSVATFGETARIGAADGQNIKIDSDSVDICDGTNVLATFGASEMNIGSWGDSTALGDTATLNFYGGSGSMTFEIGETRDNLTLTANGALKVNAYDGLYITKGISGGYTNKEAMVEPDILYNNTTGTNGTVALSNTAANYNHMRIYYALNGGTGTRHSVDAYSPNGRVISLIGAIATSDSANRYISAQATVSGTSITFARSFYFDRNFSSGAISGNIQNVVYIQRVEAWNE